MTSCLRSENLRHIVILGDSNGLRYYGTLYSHLKRMRGAHCTSAGIRKVIDWTTYDKEQMQIIHRCRCGAKSSGRCTVVNRDSAQARCQIRDAETGNELLVVIELMTVVFAIDLFDNKPTRQKTGCQPSRRDPIVPTTADNFHQYLLAEFFADPVPDLFILFGNAHDRSSLRNFTDGIDEFAAMVDRYVRPPTRLLWMSKFAEDVRRKPTYWRQLRYEYGTMSRLQYLNAANRIMYERMRRRFVDSNTLLMFPDLLPMSEPVLDDYNVDGVHMKGGWYPHVISYILQVLCTTGS